MPSWGLRTELPRVQIGCKWLLLAGGGADRSWEHSQKMCTLHRGITVPGGSAAAQAGGAEGTCAYGHCPCFS